MTTLYVLEQGAVLAKSDSRIVVRKGSAILQEVPLHQLKQVVIFGNAVLTGAALRALLRQGVDVAYLSRRGAYRGRIQPPCSPHVRLREAQYRRARDEAFCLRAGRAFIAAKLAHMGALLRRQRHRPPAVEEALRRLSRLRSRLAEAESLEEIRGYEGAATAAYFRGFRSLLRGSSHWGFDRRRAHPPTDPVNALLSLGYTLLYNAVHAAVELVGLDPYRGFYHQPKRGHAALASDLMEEWRPLIVDSLVLTLVNRGDLTPDDFRREGPQGQGRVRLRRPGLERFLKHFDRKLDRRVYHPRLDRRLRYQSCIEQQVRHFVQVLLGQERDYRPFREG